MSFLQDKLKDVSPKKMALLMLAAPILMIVAFVYFFYIPLAKDKSELEAAIINTQSNISQGQIMERKLGELKSANQKLQADLKAATEKLPTSEEDAALEDRIKALAAKSGVALKSWNSGKKEAEENGLYSQTSVAVEMAGSYHEVGRFMEDFDSVTRMLGITDFKMSSAKLEGMKMVIPVKFTLIAYSAGGA